MPTQVVSSTTRIVDIHSHSTGPTYCKTHSNSKLLSTIENNTVTINSFTVNSVLFSLANGHSQHIDEFVTCLLLSSYQRFTLKCFSSHITPSLNDVSKLFILLEFRFSITYFSELNHHSHFVYVSIFMTCTISRVQ